jgi:alpha-L-fucosidase
MVIVRATATELVALAWPARCDAVFERSRVMRRQNLVPRSAKHAIAGWLAAFAAIALREVAGGGPALCQTARGSTPAAGRNAGARHSFEDARFGLFINWGIFSLLGKGELVMNDDKLSIREYAKLPPLFNPARFDASLWVKLAKAAGARYIVVTSKHHDGFSMFATGLSDYDVVDATPWHQDPLKALAEACRQQKIALFFYYSLLDWHHPDYFPPGKTGRAAARSGKGDWRRYVTFYQGQIRELCTNYGEIGGIWLDGWWDRPDADWDLAGTYKLVHELQPGALVGNNHPGAPFPGEDFQIFGKDPPGENTPGLDKAAGPADLPRETCLSINHSWGYDAGDSDFKTALQIIHALAGAAGRGANLLLSVGPGPDGAIGLEIGPRLQEVGKWLATYGESIYGTRRGPILPQPWGVSTVKGARADQRIYLHVLSLKDDEPIVFDRSISWKPFLFGKTTPLRLTERKGSLALDLPKASRTPIDTIIVLTPKTGDR